MDQYAETLIVPSWFGSAYYIFLMRQFLMGVPKDYEEAARIDGANAFQIYSRIFMPILRPQLILVAVLNLLTVWNDYLGPLIFLQDRSKFTLALGLASFKGVHNTQIVPHALHHDYHDNSPYFSIYRGRRNIL